MNGGTMHFEMGPRPNRDWATAATNAPSSKTESRTFVQAPYFTQGDLSFTDKNLVELASSEKESIIYYSLDGGDFKKYDGQVVTMSKSSTLCTYAKKNNIQSATLCTDFIKRDADLSIDLQSEYASIYNGGAPDALIDGLRGGEDYRSGGWQGFEGQNLECIIDLSEVRTLNKISGGFLQDENSWIFFPTSVEYFASENGKDFRSLGTVKSKVLPREQGVFLENFDLPVKGTKARYLKVKANSLIKCPSWHKGALYDGKAWVFADEIAIF